MHVVIFEGSRWPTFAPLSLSRPVFCLASGMSTLLEKQIRYLEPTRLSLWVRPGLATYTRNQVVPDLKIPTTVNEPLNDEPALLVSGRTLHFGKFEFPHEPAVAIGDDGVSSAFTTSPGLSPDDVMNRTPAWTKLQDLPHAMPQSRLAAYLWDLISWNEESLVDDSINLKKRCTGKPAGPYHMLGEQDDICLGLNVKLGPGCVLDASKGPVVIDDNAAVGAHAVLQGPCYVGPSSQITPLSYIRGGTTIGPICKVGGEVSNTIFTGYSNKGHEGFVGDSYIGQWVNLGAGTTTSNLKNTYGEITIRIGKETIATGRRFLGCLIGDHTKIAIATRLMTGSYIGYCSMIASSHLTPTTVPSFTFLTDEGPAPYDRAKAKEMMINVYTRRNRRWQDSDDDLLNYAAATAAEIESAS